MSEVTFSCWSCGTAVEAPLEYVGVVVECPECESDIEVPAPQEEAPRASAADSEILMAGIAKKKKSKENAPKAALKAQNAICKRIGKDEELLLWTSGMTTPPEIYSYIPILNIYYKLARKWWLIVITDKKLHLMRHATHTINNILEKKSFPLSSVKSMKMKSGILFSDLLISTPQCEWRFKQMEKEDINPFIAKYNALKRQSKKGGKKNLKMR